MTKCRPSQTEMENDVNMEAMHEFYSDRKIIISGIPNVSANDVREYMEDIQVDSVSLRTDAHQAIVTVGEGEDIDAVVVTLNKRRLFAISVCIERHVPGVLVCLAHLPRDMTHAELREHVTTYAAVTKCFLIASRLTGETKCYGMVEFESPPEDISGVCRDMDGSEVNGTTINCDLTHHYSHFDNLHSKCLLVESLPPDYNDVSALADLFGCVTTPLYCQVVLNAGSPVGCAIVEYATSEDAEATVTQLKGLKIEEKEVDIHYCIPGYTAMDMYNRVLGNSRTKYEMVSLMDTAAMDSVLPNITMLTSPLVQALTSHNAQLLPMFMEALKVLGHSINNKASDVVSSGKQGLLGPTPDANPLLQLTTQLGLMVIIALYLHTHNSTKASDSDDENSNESTEVTQLLATYFMIDRSSRPAKRSILGTPISAQACIITQNLVKQLREETHGDESTAESVDNEPSESSGDKFTRRVKALSVQSLTFVGQYMLQQSDIVVPFEPPLTEGLDNDQPNQRNSDTSPANHKPRSLLDLNIPEPPRHKLPSLLDQIKSPSLLGQFQPLSLLGQFQPPALLGQFKPPSLMDQFKPSSLMDPCKLPSLMDQCKPPSLMDLPSLLPPTVTKQIGLLGSQPVITPEMVRQHILNVTGEGEPEHATDEGSGQVQPVKPLMSLNLDSSIVNKRKPSSTSTENAFRVSGAKYMNPPLVNAQKFAAQDSNTPLLPPERRMLSNHNWDSNIQNYNSNSRSYDSSNQNYDSYDENYDSNDQIYDSSNHNYGSTNQNYNSNRQYDRNHNYHSQSTSEQQTQFMQPPSNFKERQVSSKYGNDANSGKYSFNDQEHDEHMINKQPLPYSSSTSKMGLYNYSSQAVPPPRDDNYPSSYAKTPVYDYTSPSPGVSNAPKVTCYPPQNTGSAAAAQSNQQNADGYQNYQNSGYQSSNRTPSSGYPPISSYQSPTTYNDTYNNAYDSSYNSSYQGGYSYNNYTTPCPNSTGQDNVAQFNTTTSQGPAMTYHSSNPSTTTGPPQAGAPSYNFNQSIPYKSAYQTDGAYNVAQKSSYSTSAETNNTDRYWTAGSNWPAYHTNTSKPTENNNTKLQNPGANTQLKPNTSMHTPLNTNIQALMKMNTQQGGCPKPRIHTNTTFEPLMNVNANLPALMNNVQPLMNPTNNVQLTNTSNNFHQLMNTSIQPLMDTNNVQPVMHPNANIQPLMNTGTHVQPLMNVSSYIHPLMNQYPNNTLLNPNIPSLMNASTGVTPLSSEQSDIQPFLKTNMHQEHSLTPTGIDPHRHQPALSAKHNIQPFVIGKNKWASEVGSQSHGEASHRATSSPHGPSGMTTTASRLSRQSMVGHKRSFTELIPKPEDSPKGDYVGQHSQGIGGHYADSRKGKRPRLDDSLLQPHFS